MPHYQDIVVFTDKLLL